MGSPGKEDIVRPHMLNMKKKKIILRKNIKISSLDSEKQSLKLLQADYYKQIFPKKSTSKLISFNNVKHIVAADNTN